MTQQSLITRLKAVEEALASASCPHCGGAGYTVRDVTVAECCGQYQQNGECCCSPVPVSMPEQVQCEWCYFKDIALSDLRELIKEAEGQEEAKKSRHHWICQSPGMYDSTFICTKCKSWRTVSVDNPDSTLPKFGCTGEKP